MKTTNVPTTVSRRLPAEAATSGTSNSELHTAPPDLAVGVDPGLGSSGLDPRGGCVWEDCEAAGLDLLLFPVIDLKQRERGISSSPGVGN